MDAAALAGLDQAHAEYAALLDGMVADIAGDIRAGKDPVRLSSELVQGAVAAVILDPDGYRTLKMHVLLAVAIVRLAQQETR